MAKKKKKPRQLRRSKSNAGLRSGTQALARCHSCGKQITPTTWNLNCPECGVVKGVIGDFPGRWWG